MMSCGMPTDRHARDELQAIRACLKWLCVDQSNACLSWSVFVALAILVPALSHFMLNNDDCVDSLHSRPYGVVSQISLSSVAALSFICLSRFVSKYGLRRFLFFDKLCDESTVVRNGYTSQFNKSLKLLFIFILPCFAAEASYKIWWYSSGGSTRIQFSGNLILSNIVACVLELSSWFYRTMVYFLVCILFRLICCLQILRLQDFAQVFHVNSDIECILTEHLRIRRHLRIISHRYRLFILLALMFITASLLASLLMTTRSNADIYIYHTGELAVCSASLVAGAMILLQSAARITHKAQGLVCLAAKWHACATTIDSFDIDAESKRPVGCVTDGQLAFTASSMKLLSDLDDVGDEEDEMNDTKYVRSHAHNTISFRKRHALVTYFENNRAGITIYGFMLDRRTLHTIFGIELTLILWLLGKTVGMS